MTGFPTHCGHGVAFDVPCGICDALGHLEQLRWAEEMARKAQRKLSAIPRKTRVAAQADLDRAVR